MTRQRDPQTVPGAVMRVIGQLTAKHGAELLNKKIRQIHRYTDDTEDGTPITVEDAIRLDAAYVMEGFGPAPIHKTYTQLLASRTDDEPRTAGALLFEMLDLVDVHGQLAAAVKAAVSDAGPGGRAVTPSEAMAGINLVERLIDELHDVAQAFRQEAGLNAKPGGPG